MASAATSIRVQTAPADGAQTEIAAPASNVERSTQKGAALTETLLSGFKPVRQLFEFIGDPVMALLISVLVAIVTLGLAR